MTQEFIRQYRSVFMSKAQFFKTCSPFLAIWLADFLIKYWFYADAPSYNLGALHFSYYENHGVMMGVFTKLPVMLKTVFLGTLGIFLVSSFPLILALYQFQSKKTVYGLSIVLAGILGNVTDRLFYGFVVDYVFIKSSLLTTPVLNLADIAQWFGYILLAFGLYQEFAHHMPENNKRHSNWIDKSYQLKFTFTLLAVFLLLTATFIAFGFTFLKYSLLEAGVSDEIISEYLKLYGVSSLILLAFSSLVILLIGKTISAQIAGPAYAIKRYVQDTLKGKHYSLKFRSNDHLKDLERPLTELNDRLNSSDEKKFA